MSTLDPTRQLESVGDAALALPKPPYQTPQPPSQPPYQNPHVYQDRRPTSGRPPTSRAGNQDPHRPTGYNSAAGISTPSGPCARSRQPPQYGQPHRYGTAASVRQPGGYPAGARSIRRPIHRPGDAGG